MTALFVFLAGGAGVLARYGISSAFHGDVLPWATVAINVVGSFLLGILLVVSGDWISTQLRVTIGVGFLGGFTTFSTFSNQAWVDIEAGEPTRAFIYIAASVVLGLFAAYHADPVLLEPIMNVEVVTPEDYMGDVMGDLNRRRGLPQGMDDSASGKIIRAEVPLAEMFGYATDLRSMSQGRAVYSMEFEKYNEVPQNVADVLMRKAS